MLVGWLFSSQLQQIMQGNVFTTLQQIQARNQQTMDIKSEGNMGVAQRSLPMDPSSLHGQGNPAKTWIGRCRIEPRSMRSTIERLAINRN